MKPLKQGAVPSSDRSTKYNAEFTAGKVVGRVYTKKRTVQCEVYLKNVNQGIQFFLIRNVNSRLYLAVSMFPASQYQRYTPIGSC